MLLLLLFDGILRTWLVAAAQKKRFANANYINAFAEFKCSQDKKGGARWRHGDLTLREIRRFSN
jgi:hypothetical protein